MEKDNNSEINPGSPKIKSSSLLIIVFMIMAAVLMLEYTVFNDAEKKTTEENNAADTSAIQLASLFAQDDMWLPPDTLAIPDNDSGRMILYGRALVAHTSEYFGPKGSIAHLTNGMNCQNCHLEVGTKPFGNNFSAVASTYPRFKPRSGTLESIEKKISDCFERSLNGTALDSTGKEMKAMVAYMKWLGQNVKHGETPKGAGIIEVPFLDRPADPEKGKAAFLQTCNKCHGEDGQGKVAADGKFYEYPPLWGEHSYNIGASLYRLSKLAGYIKANMPWPTNYTKPTLTDEQAWDIAAYINSLPRPQKDLSQDWPDISKKAFDYPFGPYNDGFNETQHKYGPFTAIPSAKKGKK